MWRLDSMREIKFRVWDKDGYWDDEKRMFYNVQNSYDTIGDVQPEDFSSNFGEILRNNSYIVMQATGFKDKNGKYIYEGDIITNGDERIKYIVEWVDTGLKARQFNNQSFIGLEYWKNGIVVIGNIYENPELLERS